MYETIHPVTQARDRVSRYRDVDGFPYLLMGLALVVWGISFSIPSEVPRFGLLGRILTGIGTWVPIWFLIYQGKITEWVKARITYPRTGYVAPDPQARDWGFPEVLIFLPIFLLFGSMPFSAHIGRFFFRWVWPISLLFPVVGALMRRKAHLPEFTYVLGSILLGLLWWFIFRPTKPLGALFIVLGTSLAAIGFIRLVFYLWQNPKAQT